MNRSKSKAAPPQGLRARIENQYEKIKSTVELHYKNLPPKHEVLDYVFGKEVKARKSLDISGNLLLYGLQQCFISTETERDEIEKLLTQEFFKGNPMIGDLVFGLCVRTIYEATLLALDFPKESIVVFSGVTIQDMVSFLSIKLN